MAHENAAFPDVFRVVDLGRLDYESAYARQIIEHQRVLADRDDPASPLGTLLLVEHDPPVITISRRVGARDHLLATDEMLVRRGVQVRETDRGGDITYHGPGQLVAYPILDLNRAGMNLHAYMRALEAAVIRVCAGFGITAHRDACATGVWVGAAASATCAQGGAKICAMGVRIRRWVTMHGLALNVAPDMSHFGLIVPCGLAGRPVTSLAQELGASCPAMSAVKTALSVALARECIVDRANNR